MSKKLAIKKTHTNNGTRKTKKRQLYYVNIIKSNGLLIL